MKFLIEEWQMNVIKVHTVKDNLICLEYDIRKAIKELAQLGAVLLWRINSYGIWIFKGIN